MDFSTKIRAIADFPQPGIVFRDITPLLADGPMYRAAITQLAAFAQARGVEAVIGPEARGYVVGAPLAYALGVGFIPVRKPGKLPWQTVAVDYQLEYGSGTLEVHADAIAPGQRVLVADDLLATGGTVAATAELVKRLGGVVAGAVFLIELSALRGRDRLPGIEVHSLIQY